MTKNPTADPEIGCVTKSISKPYGRVTAMPTMCELNFSMFSLRFLVEAFVENNLIENVL